VRVIVNTQTVGPSALSYSRCYI